MDTRHGKPIGHLIDFKLGLDREALCQRHVSQHCEPLLRDFRSKLVKTTCHCCEDSKQSYFADVFGFRYDRCENCGLVFLSPGPTVEMLEVYYTNMQLQNTATITYDPTKVSERFELIYKSKLEFIAQYVQPTSLLDIGTGNGEFVHAARNLGWQADGLEINEQGIAYAKDALGIDLIPRRAEEFLASGDEALPYDVVSLLGVLEHLARPADLIERLSARAAPDTRLVIEVPKADSLSTMLNRMDPSKSVRHLQPPSHVTLWTVDSFAKLLSRTGWQIEGTWFYGMDAIELIAYLSAEKVAANDAALGDIKPLADKLQATLDENQFSDLIFLVAKRERK